MRGLCKRRSRMRHRMYLLWSLRPRARRASGLRSPCVGRASPGGECNRDGRHRAAYVRQVAKWCCFAVLAGCATVPAPPNPLVDASSGGALAVIPVRYAPVSGSVGGTGGDARASGAARGAGAGALGAGLLAGLGAIIFPPLGVPLALALAPYLVGAGAIAGYVGASAPLAVVEDGVPEEQRPFLDRTLSDALSDLRLPELAGTALVRSVTTFTPYRAEAMEGLASASKEDRLDYRSLRSRGFGGAIEIAVTRVGFTGWGGEGVSLFVTAEARLIDTTSGNPTWLRGMVYESPTYRFSRWMNEDAALTRGELEIACRTLAERVVDVLLLATEPSGDFGGIAPDTCGVPIAEPEPMLEIGPQNRLPAGTPQVSSRTPMLAWSTMPLVPNVANRSTRDTDGELRYDLRVWTTEEDAPGSIAYERLGLTGTRHQVEVPLAPGSTYFWSVRMRGTVDGHPRAVPWSMSNEPPVFSKYFLRQARFAASITSDAMKRRTCRLDSSIPCGCLDYIPAENFYRFKTP